MEAVYKGNKYLDFMLLDFIDLKVDIDSTKGIIIINIFICNNSITIIIDYDLVNVDISNLDNGKYLDEENDNDSDNKNDDDPESSHHLMYDGISGGIVSMTVMKMGLKFKPSKVIPPPR